MHGVRDKNEIPRVELSHLNWHSICSTGTEVKENETLYRWFTAEMDSSGDGGATCKEKYNLGDHELESIPKSQVVMSNVLGGEHKIETEIAGQEDKYLTTERPHFCCCSATHWNVAIQI